MNKEALLKLWFESAPTARSPYAFITPLINTQQAEVSGYQQSVRASNHKHAYKEYRKL